MPTPNWARFIILLFVGGAFLASSVVGAVGHGTARYAGIGAVMSFVVLVLLVIDRWAWRWRGIRSLLRTPDLNGTWKVELDSSYDGAGGGQKVSFLVVHQTYSKVTVELLTDLGLSCSEASSLSRRGPRTVLAYVYRAEPQALGRVGNEPHRGAAELLLEAGSNLRFEGDYWTDRKSVGRIRSVGWNAKKFGSYATAADASFYSRTI